MKQHKTLVRLFGIGLVCLMLGLMFGGLSGPVPTVAADDEVVIFPDSNLEAAIREAIDKPTGDIYQSDLEGLTELDAPDRDISNLDGLEHCVKLEYLGLYRNQITDIQPLANLINLERLCLWYNQITDIQPLANLTSLQSLRLGSNQISNSQPISDLTRLRLLELDSNQITNIQPLSNLTTLQELGLGHTEITDIQPLANLTNLQRLWLATNQITNIQPISNLSSLRYLDLNYNQITDIQPLANLTNLEKLWLSHTLISNLQPLANLANLEWLRLWSNQITDIQPLANLTSLQLLTLGNNQITDISALSGLTELEVLYLDDNQIVDAMPLSALTKLGAGWVREGVPICLGLRNNQISHVSPLVQNEGLGEGDGIDLRGNPLTADSLNIYIPQLEERGVSVLYTPDTTPPTVSRVSPEDGATDVAINSVVTASFSEAMDESTITTDSFTLAGSAVSGTVTYASDTYTATFTPDANLDYDHQYTATLSTPITDVAGNPLGEGYSWSFTTESAPAAPTVTTMVATNITTTGAALWGNLDDLGTASSVDVSFEWGETTEYGNETDALTMRESGPFGAVLADLSPSTTYHFRAKAIGEGTSYGDERSFTTGTTPSQVEIALDVPLFNQNNPEWSGEPLGTCPDTFIGYPNPDNDVGKAAGCATTCKAMVFNYYRSNYTDPRRLNKCLTQNEGYAAGCLMPWGDENNICAPPGVVFAGHLTSNLYLNIDNALLDGCPVIAKVRSEATPMHFVVITGKRSNTLTVNDPWGGERRTLAKGNLGVYTIDAIWLFRGPVVPTATGTGTATFSSDMGTITGLTAIAEGTLATAGKPAGVTFPHGLFSFDITNLAPGATVTVYITLPSAVSVGTQYWKCQGGTWVNCTSLLGDDDGDNVLTLTLTDGGLGDGDEAADGTIRDPGGPAVPPLPMSKFEIEHAKIEFKKKPDDDKVRVQGKLELDLVKGDGVEISEGATLIVGPLSETVMMVEKGKKGEKWEYKRPKHGEGNIKHVTINWKNGKFDVRMDKADLTGMTNPVTVSIQIGDDLGEETIEMKEKKHHWDYKAH